MSPIPKFLIDFPRPRRRGKSTPALAKFLAEVERARSPRKKQRLADAFLDRAREHGLPLIESTERAGYARAVFLYCGPAQKVALWSDLPGVKDNEFTRVPGTNLSYFTRELERDARMDYKFILDDGPWVLDPLNPRGTDGAFGSSSQCWMPDYVPPDVERREGIPHGAIEDLEWKSALLGNARAVKVYVPPGYAESAASRCASLYVHDGFDYLNFARIANILDNGIAQRRFPPLIAVLVPPVEREKEYDANATFARAIVEELAPQIDGAYRTRSEPQWRATLGASMGGLCAAHLAGSHPDVFGNAAGQSSAFFAETPLVKARLNLDTDAPPKPLRIHLDVGTYERYYHKDLLSGNRKFSEAIRRKSYPLQYLEVHEGHSWGSWRARIAPALEFFWGRGD
ncbi:MAG: alpha/beta hydrolase [Candidatus Acidiferrales bacterium]